MLVEKVTEVTTLKLQTGDEVITRIVKETAEDYECEQCITMAATAQGIALVPWIQTGNTKSINICKKHVIAKVLTVKEIADKYLEAVTGISVSSPSSILGV